jgi:hypothetical protein
MAIPTKPKTFKELFDFYYRDFKPLYNHLQALNEPPTEMFFEVNAALDHLSRYWHYGKDEEAVVSTASAHIKRGCFDAFKIVLRETVDHFEDLLRIDTSIIDNGEFDSKTRSLIAEIREEANVARFAEGDSRDEESWHKAYDLWVPVYVKCMQFDEMFYLNKKVDWARTKMHERGTREKWQLRREGFLVGIASSVAAALLIWLISLCF